MPKLKNKVVELKNEPLMICECDCREWLLVCSINTKKIPRRILAFECVNCGSRIKTNINMED